MDNITQIEIENTGGGCMVDIITLWNGRVIVISDESIGVYPSKDDFYNDNEVGGDESKLISECWYGIPKPKPEPMFSAYWGVGYGEPKVESHALSWFNTDRGYTPEDMKQIREMAVGEEIDLTDFVGNKHFVVRIA
jgi:hypothetical protein